jgi:hypothetical protein
MRCGRDREARVTRYGGCKKDDMRGEERRGDDGAGWEEMMDGWMDNHGRKTRVSSPAGRASRLLQAGL